MQYQLNLDLRLERRQIRDQSVHIQANAKVEFFENHFPMEPQLVFLQLDDVVLPNESIVRDHA